MVPDLTHVTSVPRFPRLLIAENNFSTVESLLHTIGDNRLDLDFDVCTSHDGAMRKLFGSPYQLVISDVHLAETDDFSLLKRAQALETFVPFVVTATERDKTSVRRGLEQGAFDVIATPVEHEQTVSSILLALWQSKLMTLITCKEKALETYRDHLAAYPSGNQMDETFKKTLTAIQQSIFSYQQTILRVEGFAELATIVRNQAKKRALERMDAQLK